MNERLTESQAAAFEKKYAITMPEDYRQFLTQIGNGGAGPYYGMFKLREMDDGRKTRR
ncbi:MAG: SMI1/KNR4 family protein [Planctomycetes bacterium]|nr:SMI1/KNR4 family protein [Planctomycetota bacterium]